MAIKKVIINGQTKVDLTDTTATPQDVTSGKVFHDASGELVTGVSVDALKAKSYGILLGSHEITSDFYMPYIQTIKEYNQFPLFYSYDALANPELTKRDLNIHLPKGPDISCQDVYGGASYLFGGNGYMRHIYFDEGLSEYIGSKPYGWSYSEKGFYTPQETEQNYCYYWNLFEALSTDSSIQYYFNNKPAAQCTLDEIVDLNKINSIGPYTLSILAGYLGVRVTSTEGRIVIPGNIKYIYTNALAGLSYITLEEGVEQLGRYAIDNSSDPEFIVPSTVQFIGAGNFKGSIYTLILKSEIPPLNDFTSYEGVLNDYSGEAIYVPTGKKQAYQNATGWSKYGDIIYEIGENAQVSINGQKYDFVIGQTWGEWIVNHPELTLENIYNDTSCSYAQEHHHISPTCFYSMS